MKVYRLVGVILTSISVTLFAVGVWITSSIPDYNHSNYTGFRFPEWYFMSAAILVFIGLMLVTQGIKIKKSKPSS